MKIIKNFNEYSKSVNEGIFDRFRKNKPGVPDYFGKPQKVVEEPLVEEPLVEEPLVEEPLTNGVLLMDAKPYDESNFRQLKYGVYLTDNTDGNYYYLGDLREFTTSKGPNPYVSYLQLDKIHIEKPHGILHSIDADAEEIIQKELDKVHHSSNLMDDNITYREEIENKFGIKILNPIY